MNTKKRSGRTPEFTPGAHCWDADVAAAPQQQADYVNGGAAVAPDGAYANDAYVFPAVSESVGNMTWTSVDLGGLIYPPV